MIDEPTVAVLPHIRRCAPIRASIIQGLSTRSALATSRPILRPRHHQNRIHGKEKDTINVNMWLNYNYM